MMERVGELMKSGGLCGMIRGAETTDESTLLAYFPYPSKPPLGESILRGLSNYQVTPRGFFVPTGGRKG